MTIHWDEQTQQAVVLLGFALCCLITGLGGYYAALRKGRSMPLWAMICTVCPPAYMLLFYKSSNRADKLPLHPIEYVAFVVSGASALLIILAFLLLAMSSGGRASSGRRQGSSSLPGGDNCYGNDCCGSDDGGCC